MPTEPDEQGTVRYIRCPSCGTPSPATLSSCSRCGKPLHGPASAARPAAPSGAAQVACPKCRKPLPAGSKFCGYCGTALAAPIPESVPRTSERPASRPEPVTMSGSPKIIPSSPRPPVPPPAEKLTDTGEIKPDYRPVTRPQSPPTPPPVVPRPTPPRVAPSATAATDGTVLFPGLRAPRIEATICERMPDGSTGRPVAVQEETTIGREGCDLNFSEDALLSPRHAALTIREGKLYLKDLGSANGTFIRQRQDTELSPGDIFLLGQGLFRFTTQSLDESQNQPSTQGTMVWDAAPKLQRGPLTAKLEQIKLTGEVVAEFRLDKRETTLGRTTGDMVFKDDRYMSGSHARIVAQPGRFVLQDLRSRNGIYRRLRQEVELQGGDEFFMGERIFRVEIKPLD